MDYKREERDIHNRKDFKNKKVDYSRHKNSKHKKVRKEINPDDFHKELLELQGLLLCGVCQITYPNHLNCCPSCEKPN